MKSTIKDTEKNLKNYTHQLESLKATHAHQKAQLEEEMRRKKEEVRAEYKQRMNSKHDYERIKDINQKLILKQRQDVRQLRTLREMVRDLKAENGDIKIALDRIQGVSTQKKGKRGRKIVKKKPIVLKLHKKNSNKRGKSMVTKPGKIYRKLKEIENTGEYLLYSFRCISVEQSLSQL
jgi:DNA repair exonuclease SbcCD ATPase subunit